MSTPASSTDTLGALAAERPGAAELFERLRLDYCCGGETTLRDGCEQRGLRTDEVLAELDAASTAADATNARDLSALSLGELCEHIVVAHHGPLRVALARVTKLLATVARVHGADQPDLHELESSFLALRADVEEHLLLEERSLFPACARLDATSPGPGDDLLGHLRHDHQEVGAAIEGLRGLTGDWDESRARCATHRELLLALQTFESDMHRHIHEENNVLFPRVLVAIGSAGR